MSEHVQVVSSNFNTAFSKVLSATENSTQTDLIIRKYTFITMCVHYKEISYHKTKHWHYSILSVCLQLRVASYCSYSTLVIRVT